MINKCVFGDLEKNDALIVILFSIICFLLTINNQSGLLVSFTLLLSCLGFFNRFGLALGIIIVYGPIISEISSGFINLFPYIPFLLSLLIKRQKILHLKSIAIFFLSILLVCFSFIFGFEPDIVYLLLQVVCITAFFLISESFSPKEVPITVFSYLLSGVVIILLIGVGGLSFNYDAGRLSMGEHTKTLAYICASPLSFLLFSIMGKSYLFRNLAKPKYMLIGIILFIVFLFVILATLARGLLISLAVGALLLILLTKKNTKTLLFLGIACLIILQTYKYIDSLGLFRTERLFAFDEYATGNGRTEIWLDYFHKMKELGTYYLLFGVGPGNIARISNTDAYAHSMIIDFFYSYGFFGFFLFSIIEFHILRKLFVKSNLTPFLIVTTLLIAYSTHGVSANLSFFIIQGLMVASIKDTSYLKDRLIANRPLLSPQNKGKLC